MTSYHVDEDVRITDVTVSELGMTPGRFPASFYYEDVRYERGDAQFSPDGEFVGHRYYPDSFDDYPSVLQVWND